MKHRDLTDKPIAFFGDIHGHWHFLRSIPKFLPNHYYVFVGDYVDSFSQAVSNQVNCIIQVLDWVDQGKATALIGNHENSYWYESQRASGFKPAMAVHMNYLKERSLKTLKAAIQIDNVLVTHAGLSAPLFNNLPFNNLDDKLTQEMHNKESFVWDIGYCRGGSKTGGGIWWNDFNEEFRPVWGLSQVFGHTHTVRKRRDVQTLGTLRFIEDGPNRSFCIDSLSRGGHFDILTYENSTFRARRFELIDDDYTEVEGFYL